MRASTARAARNARKPTSRWFLTRPLRSVSASALPAGKQGLAGRLSRLAARDRDRCTHRMQGKNKCIRGSFCENLKWVGVVASRGHDIGVYECKAVSSTPPVLEEAIKSNAGL